MKKKWKRPRYPTRIVKKTKNFVYFSLVEEVLNIANNRNTSQNLESDATFVCGV
jgi:hypothetical protein